MFCQQGILTSKESCRSGFVPARKARKVTRVMGWAERRQLSVPGVGLSMSAIVLGCYGKTMREGIRMDLACDIGAISVQAVELLLQGDGATLRSQERKPKSRLSPSVAKPPHLLDAQEHIHASVLSIATSMCYPDYEPQEPIA